jgi:excisionase family DNA binding protein
MHTLTLPTPNDAVIAQEAVQVFRAMVPSTEPTSFRLSSDSLEGVQVTLPPEALHLLVRILSHMANGDAVTLMPVQAELTTQKAADLLGVSRPFLVALLDDGTIPHRKVGTHRRVRAADLAIYQRKDDSERRQALDQLTAEAQELELGY